ncbi:MAG: M48 family metalloprotease [Candidatus Rokubacteria bacterium]|nr:M48 family metalloprotease [Candidatus Rokubacteria bacterium]
MLRSALLLVAALLSAACATVPDGAYFPKADHPSTLAVSHGLYRAAQAAGEDPARYSFALVKSKQITALTHDNATFYVSDGLARQPRATIEPLLAHEVAHEVLGHVGQRRALTTGLSTGFTVLGFVVPGVGLMDWVVSPLVVRAFTRDQEIAADLKAVEILRSMGYERPRRALADALRAAHVVNGPPRGGLLATEPALDDRLAALEPIEPLPEYAARPPAAAR